MVRSSLALGALLLSGAALAAPESLMKVDTAKGEILLEVQANGVAATKIVKVSTACNLSASAETKANAEQRLTELQVEMRKGFDNSGLKSAVLDFSAAANSGNDIEYAVPLASEAAYAAVDAAYDQPAKPTVRLGKRVGVSVSNMPDLDMARAIMGDLGCFEDYQFTRRPNIETTDPAPAQAEAKVKAIAAAKKQAEDYAAALGLRVVRIIRVSETGAIREFLGAESDLIMQEMRRDLNRKQPVSNDVPVSASISVDFVLGPK